VRPVEIGSRCQSADTGPDSGYSLVLEVSSKTNLMNPFQLEDDVQVGGTMAEGRQRSTLKMTIAKPVRQGTPYRESPAALFRHSGIDDDPGRGHR
jgi:hypothetical protein